jgi:hypothetical protein
MQRFGEDGCEPIASVEGLGGNKRESMQRGTMFLKECDFTPTRTVEESGRRDAIISVPSAQPQASLQQIYF